MFLISDNIDTQIGMRLVGVEGVVVHGLPELKAAFDEALKDPEIAILLVTEKLSAIDPGFLRDQKLNRSLPLIVEVPDRHGSVKPEDYILSYIEEVTGASGSFGRN
jgi:V/A-type H+-transporting ATPase subunit F